MQSDQANSIVAPVKLVIWDLDETFWTGTLSEEGIQPIPEHIEMVRTLADRGIISSICSKNDFETAKKALEDLGIWDMFVFPYIDWTSKGQAIASMIDRMGLRAENVLFLDDNHLNLEEAQFFNPSLMTLYCDGRMDGLLDHPHLAGKDDRDHSRLAQYKLKEQRQDDLDQSGLSNEAFLRQSQVKVRLSTDLSTQMDRVVELLNRTNQLNFTKKRIATDADRQELDRILALPTTHAGVVEVRDRYGDYGAVGFFCMETRAGGSRLHHFAFSCRAMNMGIEQWVWHRIGSPRVDIARPVAADLDGPEPDWIEEVTSFDANDDSLPDRSIVLVGGCDLRQVSFYCGTERTEFVAAVDADGLMTRYDDVGFFLTPREEEIRKLWQQKAFLGYGLDEMRAFDDAVARTDLLVMSMYHAVPTDLMFTFGGDDVGGRYWGSIPNARFGAMMKDHRTAKRFVKTMLHRDPPLDRRIDLTRRALAKACAGLRRDAHCVVIGISEGASVKGPHTLPIRRAFNQMCHEFCLERPNASFVDIDRILEPDEIVDGDHYTRIGYFKIAEFINSVASDTGLREAG